MVSRINAGENHGNTERESISQAMSEISSYLMDDIEDEASKKRFIRALDTLLIHNSKESHEEIVEHLYAILRNQTTISDEKKSVLVGTIYSLGSSYISNLGATGRANIQNFKPLIKKPYYDMSKYDIHRALFGEYISFGIYHNSDGFETTHDSREGTITRLSKESKEYKPDSKIIVLIPKDKKQVARDLIAKYKLHTNVSYEGYTIEQDWLMCTNTRDYEAYISALSKWDGRTYGRTMNDDITTRNRFYEKIESLCERYNNSKERELNWVFQQKAPRVTKKEMNKSYISMLVGEMNFLGNLLDKTGGEGIENTTSLLIEEVIVSIHRTLTSFSYLLNHQEYSEETIQSIYDFIGQNIENLRYRGKNVKRLEYQSELKDIFYSIQGMLHKKIQGIHQSALMKEMITKLGNIEEQIASLNTLAKQQIEVSRQIHDTLNAQTNTLLNISSGMGEVATLLHRQNHIGLQAIGTLYALGVSQRQGLLGGGGDPRHFQEVFNTVIQSGQIPKNPNRVIRLG